MRPVSIPVLINRHGGTARKLGDNLDRAVSDAFMAAGMRADVHYPEADDFSDAVRSFRGRGVIVVGGGDGTIAAAAAALAGSETALAVLPLGTLNHFARQLGVSPDLAEAAAVALQGHCQRIDLARVGERIFINNASVGLYTTIVRRREQSRFPKWVATIPAAWEAIRHLHLQDLTLDLEYRPQTIRTPLLFVGNNPYVLDGGLPGTRDSLSDGRLSVLALAPRGRLGLIGFGVRALGGRIEPGRDFAEIASPRAFTIFGRGQIDVAHDGEVEQMALPLEFEILPQALAVMVSPEHHIGRNVLVPRRTLA